jgi:glycogen operon protein
MLLGGDELGRTQRGNNNAYCQATDISWYDWTPSEDAASFTAYVQHLIALQLSHAALRRTTFLDGSGDPPDVAWFGAEGRPMTTPQWTDPNNHFIAFVLADEQDGDLLVVLNLDERAASLVVPGAAGSRFDLLLDTGSDDGRPADGTVLEAGAAVQVPSRTVLVAARTP